MKKFLKVLFYIIAAVYPVLVFSLLVIFKLPVRVLSLCIIALAVAFFLSATGKRAGSKDKSALDWKPLVSSALFLSAGLFCFFTQKTIFLKLYSVVISLTFLISFGSTLFIEPNMCFRFAVLTDKSLPGSDREEKVKTYCRKVTIIWCCFFILNGSIAAYTAFFCSDVVWSVYTGGISYVLMGLLFTVEFFIRRKVEKK